MTDRETIKLALEALERSMEAGMTGIKVDQAITALRQALEQPDPFSRLVRIMGTFDLSTGHADNWNDLLDSLESELRDVLGHYREAFKVEQECSAHPDAPHGFNRESSHSLGRYVCDCEGWEPEKQEHESRITSLEVRVAKLERPVTEHEKQLMADQRDLLRTAPPKREWVGLTDEDIAEGTKQSWVDKQAFESVAWWAEEKLRAKNGY